MNITETTSDELGIESNHYQRTRVGYHLQFDGALDHVHNAAEASRKYPAISATATSQAFNNKDFVGRNFANWSEVETAVAGKWEEGVKTVERMLVELDGMELTRPMQIRRRGKWDEESGEEINIDRYRNGDPYWYAVRPRPVHGPRVITILVQPGGNCNRTPEDMYWKGVLAIALTRIIEDAGYRAEIIAYNLTAGSCANGDGILTSVPIKMGPDAIDLPSLANVLSGWYFRTVEFASMACLGKNLHFLLGQGVGGNENTVHRLGCGERAWVLKEIWDRESAIQTGKRLIESLNTLDE